MPRIASAADMMPLKAKAPPPPEPLDIHGFVDVTFLNDYITPRGLLVTNTGLTTQILAGLVLDLYKDKSGFINDISVNGGVWSDLWSEQHDPHVGPWNEFDWWVGTSVTFAQNWTWGVQYIEFIPPAADLMTSFPGDRAQRRVQPLLRRLQLGLAHSDSSLRQAVLCDFGTVHGRLGRQGQYLRRRARNVPTYDARKVSGMPLVFTSPTWVTVGPSSYWNKNDGTTNVCGPTSTSPCALSNTGVVHHRVPGQIGARFGRAETAGQLVRKSRGPLLPHHKRCLAGGSGVYWSGRRRFERAGNFSRTPIATSVSASSEPGFGF